MAENLIISVSGLRGIVGQSLTPTVAAEYGCAFGAFLRQTSAAADTRLSVCLGRDSRTSGQMVASAVIAGLCSVGVDVVDLGVVTTPCVGIMVRELRCDGGVVVTASHNPIPYNGIKLLLSNGVAPPPETAQRIKEFFSATHFTFVGAADCGRVISNSLSDSVHLAKVLAIVDPKAIAAGRLKVALDSVNGAGGRIAKKLLAELGCDVVAINDEPTGLFAHEPEPTAQNVTALCDVVRAERADVGFAQDPDADRLAIVDHTGRYIGEEYTLALAAMHVFSKRKGKAAANLSTSRMIDDVAAQAGCDVIRTPVGEANVAEAMLKHNCIIGGEGNGGVIDLRVGPVRDSLVAIGLVLQLMAETGKTVGELVSQIGGYSMTKEKFAADEQQAGRILKIAAARFADARVNTADGYRFDFHDGWLHLRTSNTEPVMRMIVEAADAPAAQKYIDAVAAIRKEVLGG